MDYIDFGIQLSPVTYGELTSKPISFATGDLILPYLDH